MNRDQITDMRRQARRDDQLRKDAVLTEATRQGFIDPVGAFLLPEADISDLRPDAPGWLAEVARRVEQAAAHPGLVDPTKRSPDPAEPTARTSPYDGLTVADMDRLMYGT